MGKTKDLGHLAHIVAYDAENHITVPAGITMHTNQLVASQSYVTTALGSYALSSSLGSYVPTSRTITINGTTYDLSADRSWTIAAGIVSVSGTSPINVSTISGAATVSISQANTSTNGFLSSTDWNTFNGKQNALTIGNIISSDSNLMTVTGGTGAIIGSGVSLLVLPSAIVASGISSTLVTTALGYTPVTNARTITINGTEYDLSANRSWTVSAASAGYLTGGDSNAYMLLYNANSGDLNTYNSPGLYSSEYTGSTNKPSGYSNGHWIQISDAGGTDVKTQWYYNDAGDKIAMRLMWGNGTWKAWRSLVHDGNISSQSVNYASSSGNADTVDGYHGSNYLGKNGNSYYQQDTWIQLNGNHGLYAPSYNDAHFFPNTNSYGSWKILGSRNGWRGLHFGEGSGMTLMMNETEFGFHREGSGWYARFTNGTGHFNISGSASSASSSTTARYFPTYYAGGQQTNPQVYFNSEVGLNVAMTGAWSVWSDTLWVNGYAGGDVPWMCALHFLRNSEPRFAISAQQRQSTGYGSYYEVITAYNIASQKVSGAQRLWAESHPNDYYIVNNWTGSHWYMTSNHGSPVRVGYSDSTGQREFNYLRINSNENLYLDHNHGCSIVGVYSSYRFQGVFSMGNAYKLAIDGTSPGNLYGLSWSHPNAGGQATRLNDHGLLVMINGVTQSALSSNIWAAGDVTAYSDARVKENVIVIENAIDKINAIRGVTFTRNDMKDKTTRRAGVIAQEILEVLPEVVTEDANGHYSVAYGNLNSLLIEGIKEHDKTIKEQAKQIEELKNIINGLTR